jgi:uncharacterized protein YdcH (DUF465 family)
MLKSWVDGRKFRPHFSDEVKPTHRAGNSPMAVRRGDSTHLKEQGEMPRMDRNGQEEITAHLMQTNEQFRQLMYKHQEYDRLVEALESKPVLTCGEELEEHRLKKLKLRLKDEMEQIASVYKLQHAS